MIGRLTRAERFAAGLWIVLALVIGNGIYDILVSRGVKEYLFRHALHEAGRGPEVPIRQIMDVTVFDATWVGLLWGCTVLLAGMITVRLFRPRRPS